MTLSINYGVKVQQISDSILCRLLPKKDKNEKMMVQIHCGVWHCTNGGLVGVSSMVT